MLDMKRREFIGLVGGAAAGWPLAAHAQQPTMPTIGALVIGNINPEQFWREFRQGLRDLGYVEGQNIQFEFRSAEGHLDRLPELAAELVRLKVDIIVTWFTPTAVAAKQATHEIPIVMAETGDPIGTGLVASLPRPGGNVTGIASATAELAGKSVQLIRDMLPRARHALLEGRAIAMRNAGADRPAGKAYTQALSSWLTDNQFRKLPPVDRTALFIVWKTCRPLKPGARRCPRRGGCA